MTIYTYIYIYSSANEFEFIVKATSKDDPSNYKSLLENYEILNMCRAHVKKIQA